MQTKANHRDEFIYRHISPMANETEAMLKTIGVDSLDQLIDETIPSHIRLKNRMNLPEAMSEQELLTFLAEVASKNKLYTNYLGQGYYGTYTPGVILRNILENPGWYTAYTPYQAEIAQGRLEALLNYQTMIIDLTGMEIANASLLDEGTAAAEAMHMLHAETKKDSATKFFVSELCFPQTIDVLKTRTEPIGVELVIGNHETVQFDETYFGALIQYPAGNGQVFDYSAFMNKAKAANVMVAVAADLLGLTLLTPPGEWGADVVVVLLNVLVFLWDMADHMLVISPQKMLTNVKCRVVLLVCQLIPKATALCAWRFKHANNISSAKKLHPIFVLHKFFFLSWLPCTEFTMDQKD